MTMFTTKMATRLVALAGLGLVLSACNQTTMQSGRVSGSGLVLAVDGNDCIVRKVPVYDETIGETVLLHHRFCGGEERLAQ
jgi:hypothetical protein